MTDYKITPDADVTRILIAGRKAALAALYDCERNKDIPGSIDAPPDSYDGTGAITIVAQGQPVVLNAAIDAAVIETMVQIGSQHIVTPIPAGLWRQGFQAMWASYCRTMGIGAPFLLAFLAAALVLKWASS